jgi:hypothetical protein
MVELCRHIKNDGQRCGTPAVHGTPYCYHHGERRIALKKARVALSLANPHMPIPFVYPEDRAAIQHNLYLVAMALAAKKISERTANTYAGIWRGCRTNLGKTPLIDSNTDTAVRRVILTTEGDQIAPPRLMLEKGERTLEHNSECPCRSCAEKFRGAAPEQHHHDCQCGLCEPASPVAPIPDVSSGSEPESINNFAFSVAKSVSPVVTPSNPTDSIPTLQAVASDVSPLWKETPTATSGSKHAKPLPVRQVLALGTPNPLAV